MTPPSDHSEPASRDPAAKRPLAAGIASWRALTLAPLQSSLFRTLWAASTISNFGTVIQLVGASWMMTTLDPSPASVALVQTAAMTPIFLLALPAGALADSIDRRTLMIISQLIGFVGAATLAALAYMHLVTPATLLAITAVIGCSNALHMPAWQASYADIVPRNVLSAAVSLNAISFNLGRSIGPALGAAMMAIGGPQLTFALNAVSFLGFVGVLAVKRLPRAPAALTPEPIGAAMLSGLRYVSASASLRVIQFRGALFGLGASAVLALAPVVARDLLAGGPADYGAILSGFGAGSLVSALFAAYARQRLGHQRVLLLSTAAFSLATVGLGLSHSSALSTLLMALAGAGWILALSTLSTCVQLSAPRWVVGRAISLYYVATLGSLAVGAAAWGVFAREFGVAVALFSAAGFLFFGEALGRWHRLPEDGEADLSPYPLPEIERPPALPDARSGPIVIFIEYRVPRESSAEFLTVMHQLGRIRRRDGAEFWNILQDLDDPEIWLESFRNSTWNDHLRRASRMTAADHAVHAKALMFKTAGKSAVRRTIDRPPGSTAL